MLLFSTHCINYDRIGEFKINICVTPRSPKEALDLNHAKIYTIEHNVKVLFSGEMHHKSEKEFKYTFNTVQRTIESIKMRK